MAKSINYLTKNVKLTKSRLILINDFLVTFAKDNPTWRLRQKKETKEFKNQQGLLRKQLLTEWSQNVNPKPNRATFQLWSDLLEPNSSAKTNLIPLNIRKELQIITLRTDSDYPSIPIGLGLVLSFLFFTNRMKKKPKNANIQHFEDIAPIIFGNLWDDNFQPTPAEVRVFIEQFRDFIQLSLPIFVESFLQDHLQSGTLRLNHATIDENRSIFWEISEDSIAQIHEEISSVPCQVNSDNIAQIHKDASLLLFKLAPKLRVLSHIQDTTTKIFDLNSLTLFANFEYIYGNSNAKWALEQISDFKYIRSELDQPLSTAFSEIFINQINASLNFETGSTALDFNPSDLQLFNYLLKIAERSAESFSDFADKNAGAFMGAQPLTTTPPDNLSLIDKTRWFHENSK
ncbi:hypothetical protein [Lacticaseibacillus saniviri]